MTQLDPIVNGANLYLDGLSLTYLTTTTIRVSPGIARDSNNIMDINVGNYLGLSGIGTANSNTTLNFAVNGLNGLDQGSLANSTFYYIFAIADSSNKKVPGVIASTSATAPYLPLGYDSIRVIGAVKTDGSAHVLAFYMSGVDRYRFFAWDAPIAVTVTGSGTSATYLALDLSTGVPPSHYSVSTIYAKWDPNAAADVLNFTPSGATGNYIVNTAITTAVQDFIFELKPTTVSSVPKIDYKVSAGTLTAVNVMGFHMSL